MTQELSIFFSYFKWISKKKERNITLYWIIKLEASPWANSMSIKDSHPKDQDSKSQWPDPEDFIFLSTKTKLSTIESNPLNLMPMILEELFLSQMHQDSHNMELF